MGQLEHHLRDHRLHNSSLLTTNSISYVWGIDLSGSLQGAGGVGGLLAVVRDDGVYAPTYDGNGNVSEYIVLETGNSQLETGSVVAHYEYNPFGEIIVQSGAIADDFAFRFSTKPYCIITGILHYELRPYALGHFLARDPIEEQGGLNLYGFCANDSINKWDDYGMASLFWGDRYNCSKCGPEIGNRLIATLNKAKNEHKSLSPFKRLITGSPLHYLVTGDILFPGGFIEKSLISQQSGCGESGDCQGTYMVNGNCYDLWDINYILVGMWAQITGVEKPIMHTIIGGNKLIIKPLTQIIDPNQSLRWEYTSQVRGWANVGYSFNGINLDNLPPVKEKHKNCKSCYDPDISKKNLYGEAFESNWPGF